MKKSFILAAAVGLTVAGFSPLSMGADKQLNTRYEVRDDHKLEFNNLPGPVKQAVSQEIGQAKVTDVRAYKRGDRTVYVLAIDGKNEDRVIRVDETGKILSDRNDTEEGRVAVKYNGLPGGVKNTLGKEAKGHPMEIFQVTRDGKTWYVANIDEADGTRRVRVDSEGNLLEKPVLLADRGDTKADNKDRDRDNRDDIDARRREDRSRYNAEGEKLTFENLPGKVKQTVGAEMGRDKVTDVVKINRNGKLVYRVEIENDDRARAIWVSETGELLKELNATEEGRIRVDYKDLPGPVKSAMIKEAHDQEPKKVWQVTRGRETWFVGEANDGHLVRIDSDGKVMSHDTHPKLLSDRNSNNNARDNNANERNRDRNNAADDKKYEKKRDLDKNDDGHIDGVKMDFADLPKDVKETVRDNTKKGEKIDTIYRVKRDDSTHYIVKLEDGRIVRIGEHGGLLGQTK